MDHNKVRKQKERMFIEDPYCRRCGVLTWLSEKGRSYQKGELTKVQLNTMATIGHKFSRYDTRRYTEPHINKKHRLICSKCNQLEETQS